TLGKARFRTTDFEVSGCCRALRRGLPPGLEQAYHDCETALLYWTGPYVLSQGGFTPENVRDLGSHVFVRELGEARIEANPICDVLHYLLSRRGTDDAALAKAMQRAGDFVAEAWPEWPWRPQVIGALTLAYLLGAAAHPSPRAGVYRRWIETRS